ncbi:hypothetical protein LTR16_001297, partial [Cryomyces antarcticus]
MEVEDLENLKKDQGLLQRLRARAGLHYSPIDLDDLAARLEVVSGDRKTPPRLASSASSTTTIYDDEEKCRLDLEDETESYNTLVNEGGRPLHPVSPGRVILENPGEYREILSYWQSVNHDCEGRVWRVFDSQVDEWREFRRYQRYVREASRFTRYCQRLQERLTRHGVERPFQLNEHLDQQDKLATWIEFLNYEYEDYDEDLRFVERLQPLYDEAWKKIVDSQQATQQKFPAAQSQLGAAIKSLESIKRRNDLISEFHQKTRSSQIAKHAAERRSILLRWILQHVPLIELELNQPKVAENDLDREDGRKKLERNPADDLSQERVSKRRTEDDGNDALSKRRTRASTAPTGSQRSSTQRQPQIAGHEGQLKRNCHDSTEKGRATKRPRHSGLKTSTAAEPISTGEPLSVQSDRPEPDNSVAQVRPKPRKRQPKVYQKERESRRIAGHLPQFDMLSKR